LYHKRETVSVLLSLKSDPLVAAITERFTAGSTTAAQPGFRSFKYHLISGVPNGELALQMQWPVRSWNHPHFSAGSHLLAGINAGGSCAGIVECHGEVAVVTERLVLRGPAAAKRGSGIGK
jgi:hypothetical protein